MNLHKNTNMYLFWLSHNPSFSAPLPWRNLLISKSNILYIVVNSQIYLGLLPLCYVCNSYRVVVVWANYFCNYRQFTFMFLLWQTSPLLSSNRNHPCKLTIINHLLFPIIQNPPPVTSSFFPLTSYIISSLANAPVFNCSLPTINC